MQVDDSGGDGKAPAERDGAEVERLASRAPVTGPARLMRVLLAPFVLALNVVAALVVLFEEWGWRPLSRFMAWLATFNPWAAVERWISSLPPYPSLLVFAVPSVVLFPLKFVSLWLIAEGRVIAAGLLFAGAKVVSTAWVARVFLLTKPTLMRIGWFARAYGWFVPWKEQLFALVRQSWVWRYGRIVKWRARAVVKRWLASAKPWALAYWVRARATIKFIIQRIKHLAGLQS